MTAVGTGVSIRGHCRLSVAVLARAVAGSNLLAKLCQDKIEHVGLLALGYEYIVVDDCPFACTAEPQRP